MITDIRGNARKCIRFWNMTENAVRKKSQFDNSLSIKVFMYVTILIIYNQSKYMAR